MSFRPLLSAERLESRRPGLWRYRHALPIGRDDAVVTLGEGMTPLVQGRIGRREVLFKCDFCCPTGSFKDRGWTVAVSHLKEIGIEEVVEDSSGNAGSSLAAYGARAGIRVSVFVPADGSPAKKKQIAAYGARVVEVAGGRDALQTAALDAARDSFYAGHAWNPWFLQGTQTLAWELAEQCGGVLPDAVLMPVSQGGIVLGLYHGFTALVDQGLAASLPRLVAVQARACAPVVRGLEEDHAVPPPLVPSPSVADGLRSPSPVRYAEILEAIRLSGGTALDVEEQAILQARAEMAAGGFYVEPTSAVAVAGAKRWLPTGAGSGSIVVVLTGHGLKSGPS